MIDRERFLNEISDLMVVPDFGNALFHKVQELKNIYDKNIKYYQKIGIIPAEKEDAPGFDGQPFEITRKGKQWQPSIEIPQQIVHYLVNSEIEPGLVKMDRGVKFPGLPGKYTISFEKKNSRRITGTIQVEKDRKETAAPGGHLQVLQGAAAPQKDNLKEFLFYLTASEELYNHVMSEFRLIWKPAVDSRFFNGNITAGKFL